MNAKAQQLNLLIVEDDANLASSLKLLAPEDFKIYVASKSSLIPDHVFYHAALVDMHLESSFEQATIADGLAVIKKLTLKNPQLEVVAMSGKFDRDLMEQAITAGAQRFLLKPLIANEVNSVLVKIEAYWKLRFAAIKENAVQLVGESSASESLRKVVSELRLERSPILIEGETGVGKDVVARILNQQEGVRPFVTVNCSAISENIFESEFFGHVKGAFTGADQNKIGLAEAAHGGDLFLDEIEALPLSQQAKLLRFLESGEIRRVGAKETSYVESRVIAASNVSLRSLVAEKKFREDLFFRLSAHRIEILPLRSRKEDIKSLAEYFIAHDKLKRNKVLENDAFSELKNYSWPGNIRELKRVCEQLVLTSPLPIIRENDVKKVLGVQLSITETEQLSLNLSLDEFLKKQEKKLIEFCLAQTKDVEKSAEVLKVSKSNLYKKIKDLGITYE